MMKVNKRNRVKKKVRFEDNGLMETSPVAEHRVSGVGPFYQTSRGRKVEGWIGSFSIEIFIIFFLLIRGRI